tara:strand:+ start:405 stop:653 length:249 start_codon:yes stop_codon:yes gene_type:complete
MNKKILEQIEMCQKSIDWWQEQSKLLIKEARKLENDHAFGAITDEEMFEKAQTLDQRLDYLEKKGAREQEYMVAIISGAQDE